MSYFLHLFLFLYTNCPKQKFCCTLFVPSFLKLLFNRYHPLKPKPKHYQLLARSPSNIWTSLLNLRTPNSPSLQASFWMASYTIKSQPKKLTLFLNTSFIFLFIFYVTISYFLVQSNHEADTSRSLTVQELIKSNSCTELHEHTDSKSKCMFLKSHSGCRPKGYINYLQIFYCTCGQLPVLGHAILLLWLAVLFYLLGNTAAEYFCSSLENLSKILKLSPTIAGVTLLSLGNGAPDVFASIVSFTKSSNAGVGLNSVLGGAFFVSSAVVGVISTLVNSQDISVDKSSFIRDVSFFLLSVLSLLFYPCCRKNHLMGCHFFPIYLLLLCLCGLLYALSL